MDGPFHSSQNHRNNNAHRYCSLCETKEGTIGIFLLCVIRGSVRSYTALLYCIGSLSGVRLGGNDSVDVVVTVCLNQVFYSIRLRSCAVELQMNCDRCSVQRSMTAPVLHKSMFPGNWTAHELRSLQHR